MKLLRASEENRSGPHLGQRLERRYSAPVTDDDAKWTLHRYLRQAREAMVWKLDGLSEYDVRRPLTPTSTNLLGLVKHLSIVEAWYFGTTFDRPFAEDLPWWDDLRGRIEEAAQTARS